VHPQDKGHPMSVNTFLAAVEGVLQGISRPVHLHEPLMGETEAEAMANCARSGWVSYASPEVAHFEAMLAQATGIPHAVAMVNGTAALHLALILAGVRPGDEVLMPALTFAATANAAAQAGAIPHFADSDPRTLGLNPAALEAHLEQIVSPEPLGPVNRLTGRRIAALVPVHVFGHSPDMDALAAIAARHAIPLVEDTAEALGSSANGRHAGGHGLLSILSFNGNKIVTTGGGGAILTSDPKLAARARHLSTTAKKPHPWRFEHDETGFNYRMPGVNAALGVAQLGRLEDFLERKRRLAARYQEAFRHVACAEVFREHQDTHGNHWLNAALLYEEHSGLRDAVLEEGIRRGVHMRPAWTLLHRLPMYAACPRADLAQAESLERRIICLPSSAGLMGASDE